MNDHQKNKADPENAPAAPAPEQAQTSGKAIPERGKKAPQPVVNIRPMARPARMKRRHWGMSVSFLLLVVAPLLVVGWYLWAVADDRFSSTTGFTVRQEEGNSATDLLGGLAQFTGSSSSPDGDVLYEFILSQEIVQSVDERLDLRSHYSAHWASDPVFALWPDATIEDLHWYWERVVRASYDQATGLIELKVFAFDPEMARRISQEIVAESEQMVNALNQAARADAIKYAEEELLLAEQRLKSAREAMTGFRTRTQIVDLESDIQGRMGVMNTLQQQLAAELVAFDELTQTTKPDDPRLTQALRRIQVIRERIAEERTNFATTEVLTTGEDYPTLIAEFEGLAVEREFAEAAYGAALTARDAAYANAARQSRYLAAYIQPTLAESSEYPQRFVLLGLTALVLLLGWGIIILIYYSLRDRN